MKVVFAVVQYAMVVQGTFSRPHSTPSTAAVRHDQLSFAFFDFLVESEPSDSATAQRAATEYDDLDTFFRKLQAGRSGTESFLDGQLRGSGLLDDVKENKDFTKVINTDMALPRSYAVVGPRGWSSRGSDGGKSGGGDDHDDDAYYYYDDYDYGSKGNKGGKSSRGGKKAEQKHKQMKRGKGEEKNIDKKLKVDGYFDDDLLHPYLDDDWHYDKWAWEYDGGWYEDEIEYHEENAEWSYRQSDMGALKRAGPVDDVMPPSLSLSPTVAPGPTGLEYTPDDMTHLGMAAIQARSIDGSSSGGSLLQKANGLNVIPQSGLPQTITKPQHLAFSFPTIQHMIYSGSINLKAHSAYDLSQMDPEIFGVLQSMLTPYLQAIVGHTLQAYNLEVDYTPGHAEDQSAVAAGGVVTNLEVACTLKVRSDSVASLKRITHKQAKQWIRDFFSGHEMGQFLNELSSNNINVNEIVFVEDQFATPANGGQVIAGIESGGNGNGPSSSSSSSSSDGNPGVVIGVAIAMVAVGAILFLHFTGHLPYREKLSELRILMRHSLSCDSGSEGYHGGSSDGNGTKDEENDQAPSGRRRTWSATFRRHPDAGIRKAALQKKPARSEDYLSGGSTSTVSKQSNSSGGITNNTPLSSHKSDRTHGDTTLNPFEPDVDFDDYSYSVGEDFNVGGDYDMAMRSRGSPSRRSSRPSFSQGASPRTNTAHTRDDEFSMPEDYDTVLEGDSASLYSKWSQSVMTKIAFMPGKKRRTKMPTMSPPPGSPRRVTPSDLGSTSHRFIPRSVEANAASVGQNALNGRDEWSVDSYDTKSPSAHCVYRDWSPNGNGVRDPTAGSSSRRTKLAIPRFN